MLFIFLLLFCNTPQFSLAKQPALEEHSFYEWVDVCNALPYYKDVGATNQTALTFTQFIGIIDKFSTFMQQQPLNDSTKWLSLSECPDAISRFSQPDPLFQPFVQKALCPFGSKIIFKGDIHGDIHSLIQFIEQLAAENFMDLLDPFKIQDPSLYLVFLGDYVDKGIHGAEVLYTLLRLKMANPDQVFLIRGNHENIFCNQQDGFAQELFYKFTGRTRNESVSKLLEKIDHIYRFMPACLFLGITDADQYTHYLQCCHGGMEIGHNPKTLLESDASFELLTILARKQACQDPCLKPFEGIFSDINLIQTRKFSDIGYMWSDFSDNAITASSDRGPRIFSYGSSLTDYLLEKAGGPHHRICAIMRAHQHSPSWTPLMELILDKDDDHPTDKGCGKLWREKKHVGKSFWNGIVCTLMASPDTPLGNQNNDYPGNNTDYWITLYTLEQFDAWYLTVKSKKIYQEI